MAIVLIALAVFGVLSLVSAAAGQNPNLCGILGGAAAAAASDLFGVQAYVLAFLVAMLAIRVWSGASGRTLMRESLGGASPVDCAQRRCGTVSPAMRNRRRERPAARLAVRLRRRSAATSTWAAAISA